MIFINNTKDFVFAGTVVTIGKFDGLHLGHQELFDELLKQAAEHKLTSVILSLEPVAENGLAIPGKEIYSDEERVGMLSKHGPDVLIKYPFDRLTMNMTAEEFVKTILIDKLGAKHVVVGDDFCFGRNRGGNTETLVELGKNLGFGVTVCPEVAFGGARVSSSLIRQLLRSGDTELAEILLNRKWFEKGRMEK